VDRGIIKGIITTIPLMPSVVVVIAVVVAVVVVIMIPFSFQLTESHVRHQSKANIGHQHGSVITVSAQNFSFRFQFPEGEGHLFRLLVDSDRSPLLTSALGKAEPLPPSGSS